jgi:hypothetical protein
MLSRLTAHRHGLVIALGSAVTGLAIVFLQEVARGLGWL